MLYTAFLFLILILVILLFFISVCPKELHFVMLFLLKGFFIIIFYDVLLFRNHNSMRLKQGLCVSEQEVMENLISPSSNLYLERPLVCHLWNFNQPHSDSLTENKFTNKPTGSCIFRKFEV